VEPGSGSARRATRATFLTVGIVSASLAPLVPDIRLRLGLDDGGLGLLLLGVGAGALIATPLAGMAIGRFGCRRLMLGLGLAFCLLLPLATVIPGIAATAMTLLLFGAAMASVDVTMNAQAVRVERAAARPMMSGFHGLFSLGGLIGAALVSLFLYLGAGATLAALPIAGAGAVVLLGHAGGMLPRVETQASAFAVPHGRLALIGGLCFIGFLAEGAVHDWSAVLLRFDRGAAPAAAGLAYAAFASAMALGRLTGDALLRRVAAVAVLRLGALVAGGGFVILAQVPVFPAALLGCAMIGIGEANIVPVLFSAAARTRGMEPGAAIAAAATPGYIGLLAGPALIGFGATFAGLPMALAATGLLFLAIIASARFATSEVHHG
jgi:predicted MFS family arabinose efflux permease